MSFRDDWPTMPDDRDFDGTGLFALVCSGKSSFHGVWEVSQLIREMEEALGAEVTDIPVVNKGSNNYVRSLYWTYRVLQGLNGA